MGSSELITIVAPAYNHEKYIIDSLSSISQQTYWEKELIIIDDASSDKTPEYIEKYINRDIIKTVFPGGITFLRHHDNKNAHKTLNEGICLAKGKYIAIINTDDLFETNRVEVMLNAIIRENALFAFSKVRCIDEQGEEFDYELFDKVEKEIQKYSSTSLALCNWNVSIGTGNFVFTKKLFNELGGFNETYHFTHDWDFALRAALISEPLFVPQTVYKYRFHSTNTIKQISQNQENEIKKNKEVNAILKSFLENILNHNVQNPAIKDVQLWDYYLRKVSCSTYASYLWEQLREKTT